MKLRAATLAFCFALLAAGPYAHAQPATPTELPGDDPRFEQRFRELTEELRCVVCQNQSLADSNAPLASDLRREVREQMNRGLDDKQVVEYLVARYGEFVRYRPALNPLTAALWGGPFLLLVLGAAVLLVRLRRRAQQPEAALSAEEHALAQQLLAAGPADKAAGETREGGK
ncbi:MAG: cytochrome c-type biogenesis protein CcmH [Betaproteobacteria bacterium]|nr:cytochrome c-type biogenesis protein CcmH [Betaproteobacteria bacterium]